MRLDNRYPGENFFNEINAIKEKCNFLWCCKPVSLSFCDLKALQAFFPCPSYTATSQQKNGRKTLKN